MAIGDMKSDIISFWNEARKDSLASDSASLDIAIQTCLNDLSNSNLLLKSDTTQSLTSASYYLEYPDLYKDLVPGGIILNDGNYDLDPLEKLGGGWREYGQLMNSFNSGQRSIPRNYAEHNSKFYLWAPPGQTYTTTIWFYKYHAQSVSAIEFDEDYRNVIKFGTVYYKSLLQGIPKYITIWKPMYEDEKTMRRLNMNVQPNIVRG